MSNMTPRQIMHECHQWEDANPGKHISCFTIRTDGTTRSVRMITGDFRPHERHNVTCTLYVRVLLDDEWRFFPRYKASEDTWEFPESQEPAKNPVDAILKARENPAIRAFRSDGWYTTSNVTPDEVYIHEFNSFNLPYHGTWIRTGTP